MRADRWLTDDKVLLDLREYSSAYVCRVATASVWRWISGNIEARLARPELARGVWWVPRQKAMHSHTPGAAYLRRVVAGAEHAQAD